MIGCLFISFAFFFLGRKGATEIYHVQYFGKIPSHGWTTGKIMHFEGEEKYFAERDKAISAAPTESKKKKLKMKYHVPVCILLFNIVSICINAFA